MTKQEQSLDNVIDFLENLKKLRLDKIVGLNYEEGDLPFGTCDYHTIESLIIYIKELKSSIQQVKNELKEETRLELNNVEGIIVNALIKRIDKVFLRRFGSLAETKSGEGK